MDPSYVLVILFEMFETLHICISDTFAYLINVGSCEFFACLKIIFPTLSYSANANIVNHLRSISLFYVSFV